MPDSNEQHLPFFMKTDVYDHFVREFRILYSSEPPTESYFYATWKANCAFIKVRKLNRFTKCTLCEELRAALEEKVAAGLSTTEIKRRKHDHNEMIGRERRYYKKKRDHAILLPREHVSIIVDGADQSAFGLPHFTTVTKDTRGHSLKVKLIGVLEHARPKKLRLLTLTEEHETGANHVIEAVHRFLTDTSRVSDLPRVFYVQVDNCTRENKNRFFMAFIECLVAWSVFEEVEVGFLPVGHTHEDIDQSFSSTSARLRSNNAVTLQELHSELRKTYNGETEVSHMKHVANWSGLCAAEKCLTNVKHFSTFRYFRFSRSKGITEEIKTVCFVRPSVDAEWETLGKATNGNTSSFIRFPPDLKKTPPTKIILPRGRDEINKRFISEEGRINSTAKMRDLYSVRDHVFRAREEPFHWDLTRAVEVQAGLAVEDPPGGDNADEVTPEPPGEVGEADVHNDYEYMHNSFVAVRPAPTPGSAGAPSHFWIGKVCETERNAEEKIVCLTVHWYELSRSADIYTGKYGAAFLHNQHIAKRKPWKDTISSDTVLLAFEALTRRGALPAAAQKFLRREFPGH